MGRPRFITVKAGTVGDRRAVIAVHARELKRPPADGLIRVPVEYGKWAGLRPETPTVGSVVQLADIGGLCAWVPATVPDKRGPLITYHCSQCEVGGRATAQKARKAPVCSCGRRKTRRKATAVTVQLSPSDAALLSRAAETTGEKRATLAGRVLAEWLAEQKPE